MLLYNSISILSSISFLDFNHDLVWLSRNCINRANNLKDFYYTWTQLTISDHLNPIPDDQFGSHSGIIISLNLSYL